MKKTMRLSVLAMGVAVAGAWGYSNPIEGGSTEVVTNQWNVAVPWLMVGGNSSSNTLHVADGGRVDSQIGIIGNNATSMGNSAFVSGSNAVWNSTMEIAVGNQGSDNTLGVFGGGRVDTANAYIGKASSNNLAFVSDAGSELLASTLHVGHTGSDNVLGIFDGGRASSIDGSIGYWIGSDDNSVLVTGTNSIWNNTGVLNVGEHGSDNLLMIVDGGTVQSPVVNLGVQSYSSNNAISVWGDGALLDAPELNIGGSAAGAGGTGNRVSVRDGGTVAITDLNIYAGNNFDLNNGGRLAVSTNFNAAMSGFNFNAGGTLEVGGELTGMGSSIEDQRMIVMNGSNALWNKTGSNLYVGQNSFGNSMVVTNGALIRNNSSYVGYNSGSSDNSVVVSGSNSMWNSSGRLTVGYRGDNNSVMIENGGQVVAYDIEVAQSALSSGNRIVVTGDGSRLTTTGGNGVIIGLGGSGNHLEVSDGAVLDAAGGIGYAILGYGSDSASNSMLVDDATVQLKQIMYVGLYGSGNHMAITNGGVVRAQHSVVGRHTSSDGNSAIVTGAGSLLESREKFFVGSEGSGNTFIVADGGEVRSDIGYIGTHGTARDNTMLVTGQGSKWVATNELYVGHEGSDNHLSIEDGGRVESASGIIGYEASASGNATLVSGAGSVWDVTLHTLIPYSLNTNGYLISVVDDTPIYSDPVTGLAGLNVGYEGSGNSLIINAGGRVESLGGHIGYGETATDNSVLVMGAGSSWDNSGPLYVGHNGSGNALRIENGAHVESFSTHIGYEVGANGNSVLVSGQGSMLDADPWTIYLTPIQNPPIWIFPTNQYPIIPVEGAGEASMVGGSRLFVASGSSISSPAATAGTGSSLVQSGNLTVGSASGGNSIQIVDGGSLVNGGDYLGDPLLNPWLPIDSGSGWLLPDPIFLGPSNLLGGIDWSDPFNSVGTSNLFFDGSLSVTNWAGSIFSTNTYVGIFREGTGELAVGRAGSGNVLRVEDGGHVISRTGYIGRLSSASNNTVFVSGNGSSWRNSQNLYLGGMMGSFFGEVETNATGDLYLTRYYDAWIDGGTGNSLYVGDGGLVSVGRDMHNRNYSTVSIDPGGHISVSSNYYQDATSVLRFGVETNAAGAPLNALVSVDGTAEFEEGATLQYHSNVGLLDFDTFYTNLIVEADQLIIAGVTNANALDLEAINLDGSLVEVLLWEASQNIYGLVGRKYLAASAGFADGSMMARLAKEIDDLSLLGNPGAVGQINLLNRMSSAQQNRQLTQLYEQGVPTYQHRQGMQGGQKQVLAQSRVFQAGNRSSDTQPPGAAGPHEADQGLRGWMRGYGNWAEHEESNSFSDFSQNAYGTVVGLDRTFGSVLLGAAGGYAYSDLTQENRDSSNAKTGFGVLYGSFGSTDWFGDLNFSYGRSRIETRSGTLFGAKGTSDADNYSVYLGGGKELSLSGGDYLFAPEAALVVSYFDQDGYSDGLRDIDAYDRWSYQSRLGASITFPKETDSVVWIPEARVYWLHEFNADFDQIGYSLVGGSGRYVFGVQAPVEDLLEAGVGLSAIINDRLEIVFDVDGQYSGHYEAITVSGRVAYEF